MKNHAIYRHVFAFAVLSLLLGFAACAQDESGEKSSTDSFQEVDTYYPAFEIDLDAEQSKQFEELDREHPSKEDHMLRLAARLDLSEDQIADLEPIFDELHANLRSIHEQMRALHDSGEHPPKEEMQPLHEQMHALKEAAREEIRLILTDEQNEAFDALLEECRAKRGEGERRPPPTPGS